MLFIPDFFLGLIMSAQITLSSTFWLSIDRPFRIGLRCCSFFLWILSASRLCDCFLFKLSVLWKFLRNSSLFTDSSLLPSSTLKNLNLPFSR